MMMLLLSVRGNQRKTQVRHNGDVSTPDFSADLASCKGKLLVATPPLTDPNFDRTVVLMLEHTSDGAVGVVLNRPTDENAPGELYAWTEYMSPPATLFNGGPANNPYYWNPITTAVDSANIDNGDTAWTLDYLPFAPVPAGLNLIAVFQALDLTTFKLSDPISFEFN